MLTRCISVVLLSLVLLHTTNAATYTFVKWYLAGNFNGTKGATNVPSSQYAVGLDISRNQFFGLGNGTDRAAVAVAADSCNNIYYAGAFSTANGQNTGPIAMFKDNDFTSVAAALPGFLGSIQAIALDCPVGSCNCDLWIGGSFTFNAANGSVASCVAHYSTATQQWSALGGAAAHNITIISPLSPVAPVTTVKRMGDNVYFGGSFSGLIKSYSISTGTWSLPLLPSATAGTPNGFAFFGPLANTPIIHDMRVVTFGSTSALYVGGNFAQTGCNFVCGYINGVWATVGGKNQPNGPVFGMSYDNSSLLYIAGNFSGLGGSTPNIAVTTLASDKLAGSDFGQAGGSPSFTIPPVYKIDALDRRFGYSSGSYGYTVLGGLAFFYSADVRIHFPFGTATFQSQTNLFTSIVGVPFVTNNAFIAGASMPLIFMCMLVLMFFFNQ